MVMVFQKLHLSRALLPKSGATALNFAPYRCTSASSRHGGTICSQNFIMAPILFHPLLPGKLRVLSCLRRVNGQSLTFAFSKNSPIPIPCVVPLLFRYVSISRRALCLWLTDRLMVSRNILSVLSLWPFQYPIRHLIPQLVGGRYQTLPLGSKSSICHEKNRFYNCIFLSEIWKVKCWTVNNGEVPS